MAKQLNVNLALTADTSKAKASVQELQKTLEKAMNITTSKNSIDASLQKSISLAAQLKVQLQSATMPNGSLDLSKFTLQMQKSNVQLKDYKAALSQMGTEGKQAFSQLASSIVQSEIPLKRTNAVIKDLGTTLMNTVKWQLSSSLIHGFMGAIQQAYGYAQDLNESLNNIRIVTGQNEEQMAKFAERANKAAQALSTTTTAYTDAALIFYQQGLSDDQVEARTEATIKLANVTRQSAEEISSQMTAIWNNFAKGSETLDHYGDVITALGARTAASSEEIASGMSKFAAIADTVGLSYDKAAAAIATVVAETRQSADIVGTAFKTIFARLEGLNLGETLEDGVTLNKYSAALEKVGVNILDQNNNLKTMDAILDELGNKWNNLSEAQQVALSETVAGTRQYAQFIALMNNYDKVLSNQDIAETSDGTLQKQADIYAESWEAAQKRVKAAAQAIYSDLLDDKFFINILNGIEKTLKGVDGFIDAIGGVGPLLTMIGSIVFQVFGSQITAALQNTIDKMYMLSDAGRQAAMAVRQDAIDNLTNMLSGKGNSATAEDQGMNAAYSAQAKLQQELINNADKLTESEKAQAQILLDINKELGEQAIQAGKNLDQQIQITKQLENQMKSKAARTATSDEIMSGASRVTNVVNQQENLKKAYELTEEAYRKYSTELSKPVEFSNMESIPKSIMDIVLKLKEARAGGEDFQNCLENMMSAKAKGDLDAFNAEFKNFQTYMDAGVIPSTQRLEIALRQAGFSQRDAAEAAAQLSAQYGKQRDASTEAEEGNKRVGKSAEEAGQSIREMGLKMGNPVAGLTALGSAFMGLNTVINSFKNTWNEWKEVFEGNGNIGKALLSTLMTLGMTIPIITNLTKADTIANIAALNAKIFGKTATEALTAAEAASVAPKYASAAATWAALGPWLIFIGIAAAIVSGIVAIVRALNAESEAALKAKEASESAKELAEAAANAKDELNKLESAFDGYKSLVDKFNQCKKGTDEWKEALQDVNSEVLKILETYPELLSMQGAVYRDENGMLHITEEAMNSVLNKAQELVNNTQAALITAQAMSSQANVASQTEKFNQRASNIVNGITDRNTGEEFSTGDFLMSHASELMNLTATEFKNKISEILQSMGYEQDLANQVAELMLQLQGDFQALSAATRNAAEQMNSAAKIVTDEELARNGITADAAESRLVSEAYERDVNNAKNEMADMSVEDIIDRYNAATGSNYTKNDVHKNDNGDYYFGDNEANAMSADAIKSLIAVAEASDKVVASFEAASRQLNTIGDRLVSEYGNNSDAGSWAVKDFVAGEGFGKHLTKAGFEIVKEDIASSENGLTDYLETAFGEPIEMVAAKLDMSTEELLASVQADIDAMDNGFSSLGEGISNSVKKVIEQGLDDSVMQGATLAGQNAIAEALQNAFEQGGREGLDSVAEIFNQLGAQSGLFGEILADFNWATNDIEDFKNACKQAGIDLSNIDLTKFGEFQEKANIAIQDINTLTSNYKTAMDEVKDLNIGDIIDPSKFAQLDEWQQQYFTLMADGTYKLIGNAEELVRLTQQLALKDFANNINNLQEKQDALSNAMNYQDDISTSAAKIESHYDYGQQKSVDYVVELDTEKVQAQLDALFGAGLSDQYSALIADIKDSMESGIWDPAQLQALADAVGQLNIKEIMAGNTAAMQELQNAVATTATSLNELDAMTAQLNLNEEAQQTGLINLANQYENCKIEIEDFTRASDQLKEATQALADAKAGLGDLTEKDAQKTLEAAEANYEAANSMIQLAIKAGELGKRYNLSGNEIESYAKQLGELEKYSEIAGSELAELAKDQLRYDRAVTNATKNLDNWKSALKNASDLGLVNAEALDEMANAYGDLLDLDPSSFSNSFLKSEKNLQLLEDALNGVEGAYEELQNAARQDIEARFGLDDSEFQKKYADLYNQIEEINNNEEIEVGASLDTGNFLDQLTQLVNDAHMTAEQATNYLSSMGIDAEIETVPAETEEIPTTEDYWEPAEYQTEDIITGGENEGQGVYKALKKVKDGEWISKDSGHTEETSPSGFSLKVTSANKSSGGNIKRSGSGASKGSGKGKGGGGGGKGKGGSGKSDTGGEQPEAKPKSQTSKKKDPAERYHAIKKQIENLTKAYEKANSAKDRLFGVDKLKALETEIKLTDQLINKQKAYLKEIKNNLKIDTNNLLNGKAGAYEYTTKDAEGNSFLHSGNFEGIYKMLGIAPKFDKDGVLLNYSEIMTAANQWYATKIDAYNNASGEGQEAMNNAGYLDQVNGQYDALTELLGKYEETMALWRDEMVELTSLYRQVQDLNLEKTQYTIEVKALLSEADLKRLENIRKSLADDVWKSVEYLSLLYNSEKDNLSTYEALMKMSKDNLASAEEILKATYGDPTFILDENGNLKAEMPMYSQTGWLELLNDSEEKLYDNIERLQELDDELISFYENTLTNFRDELDELSEKIASNLSVLEHYRNLATLFNKQSDYAWLGNILDSIVKIRKTNFDNYTTDFNNSKKLYEQEKKAYEDLVNSGASEETLRKFRENQLAAAEEAYRNARENLLTSAEEYADAIVEAYENELDRINKNFEKELAGDWSTFDALNDAMSRVSSTQDLLLTKTNQIYETNKLIRQLAQDIDKTDNLSAKTKLANFQKEIEALQQQNQMSKFDLDVAKARYELLLAQIALEEAQNAKSTVRLQRDSEGNYGYVYTADQDKINSAAQNLADKENELYNLSLNKANANSEALLKLEQEYFSARDEIAKNYNLTEEERNQQLYDLREQTLEKAKILLGDYTTALYWLNETAATGIEEAWSDTFKDLILSADDWEEKTQEDIDRIMTLAQEKDADLKEVADSVTDTLGDIGKSLEDLVADTNALGNAYIRVSNNATVFLEKISSITSSYFTQRDALMQLIDSMQDYISKMDQARAAALSFANTAQYVQDVASTPNPTYVSESDLSSSLYSYSAGSVSAGGGVGSSSDSGSGSGDSSSGSSSGGSGNVGLGTPGGYSPPSSPSSSGNFSVRLLRRDEVSYKYVISNVSSSEAEKYYQTYCYKYRGGDGTYKKIEYLMNGTVIKYFNIPNPSNNGGGGPPNMLFDSGGYTGNWVGGSDRFNGKFAMLHEKELVLNKEDTKNFLDAVNIVRSISQIIDLRAAAQGFSSGLSSFSIGSSSSSLEQSVTIHAEFPNAVDHNEIQEAFNTLINRASQYAGRY